MQATLTRKPTEIKSAVIYRCTDKATHETFYLVASDSEPGAYHTVHFDESRLAWTCSCPAHKPCKHQRAVQEVVKARHARQSSQPVFIPCPSVISDEAYILSADGKSWKRVGKRDRELYPECRDMTPEDEERLLAIMFPMREDDVDAHVEDSIRSGEFSWVEQEQARRDAMTPEQRQQEYRARYADDYHYDYAA